MQNDQVMKNVAAAIEKEGISAFRFDFSGNGYVSLACFIIVLHQ
jgi:alpha/beta superfamily hydrolase